MQFIKIFFGWILIIIGLVIVFTPFTPGSISLPLGFYMVFGHWPEWKELEQKIKEFFWR